MNLQNIILLIIMVLLCGIGGYLRIRKTEKIEKSFIIYMAIACVIILGITLMLELFYKENDFCHNLKRIALMSVLAPIAYIDFKELKIPNEYIILGIIYWVLIIPLEIVKYNKYVITDIKSSLIAAGVLFLASALCKICIKGSIGAGDIKLFVVMGLLLGVRGIWGAMFLSLIVSFFVALFFLITKKKSKKDEMAFGPALAIGTFAAIFLTGM